MKLTAHALAGLAAQLGLRLSTFSLGPASRLLGASAGRYGGVGCQSEHPASKYTQGGFSSSPSPGCWVLKRQALSGSLGSADYPLISVCRLARWAPVLTKALSLQTSHE